MTFSKPFVVIAAAAAASLWLTSAERPAASPRSDAGPLSKNDNAHLLLARKVEQMRQVALAPHPGDEPIDREIRAWQARVGKAPILALERLGRLFIAKARLSNDPGFYKIAEQCARYLSAMDPANAEALLLRAHVLAAMHSFREAEAVARELITFREHVLDYAVLGDALMEQGRVDESIPVYQQMVDLKPCLESYARIAHVRWLKGDLAGAIEMMEQAVESAHPRDRESLAWASTRLAVYQLQAGRLEEASQLARRALAVLPDYAAALLVEGRILLASGQASESLVPLRRAAADNPLPEYEWILADALRAAHLVDEAAVVERNLKLRGQVNDPRTYALYLATREEDARRSIDLARAELETRRDIFTLDALAWALYAAGELEEAETHSRSALREGTLDARLFLHAGTIAAAAGKPGDARHFLQQAEAQRQMLLPSESERLTAQLALLPPTSAQHSSVTKLTAQ